MKDWGKIETCFSDSMSAPQATENKCKWLELEN